MAVYDLEEQEQLEEIKAWWKVYGNLVTGIILLCALVVLSWQGWGWWQRSESAKAGSVFSGVQQAVAQNDAKRARELAGELIDKYSSTNYAVMGALVAARVQVDAGDAKNARVQLAWAVENAKDDGLRDLARLRLASVLLDEKLYDEAYKQVSASASKPFLRRFAELRGDILATQGKLVEARSAYDIALTKTDDGAKPEDGQRDMIYNELLQAKRQSLVLPNAGQTK